MLFAMGGYGTYLGFRIRFSDNIVKIHGYDISQIVEKGLLMNLLNVSRRRRRQWLKTCILSFLEECFSSLLLEPRVVLRLFSLPISPSLKGMLVYNPFLKMKSL